MAITLKNIYKSQGWNAALAAFMERNPRIDKKKAEFLVSVALGMIDGDEIGVKYNGNQTFAEFINDR